MASFFFLLSIGFTFILSFLFYVLSKSNRPRFGQPPPGKNGWPILGESLDFTRSPNQFIRDRMKEHSPDVFKTSLGWEKVVFFCGPLANKFIYSNESKFHPCLPDSMSKALSLNLKSPSCKLFFEHLHNFLKLQTLQDYVPVMDAKTRQHMEEHWVPNKVVKVNPLAREITFTLACNLLMSYKNSRELAEAFYTLAERVMSMPVNLPGTSYNMALKASKFLQAKLIALINKRKEDLLSTEEFEGKNDLLSRVLMASDEDGNSISDNELVGQILGTLFASFYTASTAITFTLSHLAQYPQVYDKVLQEQLEIAHSKREGELLTWKDIQRMKYSWNVVSETMRLRPPAVGGFREVLDDFPYAGFTVPKGWKVHWSVYSTHMDPTYFPNPENFDPSRFEKEYPPNVYVPFGGGPHMCCGREYARIEILVYLHNVVTRFQLSKINPQEKIIYKPDPFLAEGLRMHLQPHVT